MDLHNLHRPTPSAAQQTSQHSQAPTRVSAHDALQHDRRELAKTHETSDLARELEKARAHASHWQKETERMDRIARTAMDKVEAKRAAKAALKAEYLVARKDADTWRTRYNELSAAKKASASNSLDVHDRLANSQLAEQRVREDLSRTRQALAQHETDLAKARQALALHQADEPKIKERLLIGGDSFRKLQTLAPRLAAAEKRAQEAESKLATVQQQKHALEQELAALKATASRQADLDAVRNRQASSDLAAAKEKLRTATNDLSAKTAQVQSSADMLARTEQVLHTCSQLFATKEPAHPLAQALCDSTAAVRKFLAKMEATSDPHA